MRNKYYLSIEFHRQDTTLGEIQIGELVSFICYKGLIRVGVVKDIKLIDDTDIISYVTIEYQGIGRVLTKSIRVDYIIKKNTIVNNVRSYITEEDIGFPLRT